MARISRRLFLAGLPLLEAVGRSGELKGRRIYVVPNFHPASCGWLTNFSKERVYCANTYFDHLDRVRDDPNYAFVLSEVNNMIAMMNFKPERIPELKRAIGAGRVELVNAFFLESTINLPGGEALVRLGVEGLRWQKQMFGVRPRFAWTIDVCGTHDQMAQISAGLGLEAMVYTRKNPTGSAVHWALSPDGSKIMALSPGHYSEFGDVMSAKDPLTAEQTAAVETALAQKLKITPAGAPVLILAGKGDYALAPLRKENPSEFLERWKQNPDHPELRFAVLSKYLDELQALDRAGKLQIPVMRGGTAYDFDSFWIECPRVKSWYRLCEHRLQAAESMASIASLNSKHTYPSQDLYRAWTLLFLNSDRNTLWGSAGGMVFEHETSWDVKDRFEWIESHTQTAAESAARSVLGAGEGLGLFNPANWTRHDPVLLPYAVEGVPAQLAEGGRVMCQPQLAPVSAGGWKKSSQAAAAPRDVPLPATISTRFYDVRVNPKTGDIDSIRLKSDGREMLGAAANVIVAERSKTQKGDPGDFTQPRPERDRLDATTEHGQIVTVRVGLVASVVEAQGSFIGGGLCRRTVTFYNDYPRIDFATELNDLPDRTVVVAEFPLAGDIKEVRRGIPFGFSHGAWPEPNPDLHGWTKGIVPAVRWSHYAMASGGGVALLDRGLSGRELNGRTPVIYLYNATDKYYGYPNSWLSGKGRHIVEYALVAHGGDWKEAQVPQMAWEFNCPPVMVEGCAPGEAKPALTTSANVVVEAMRRTGNEIELRLVECLGYAGTAGITLNLPHKGAAMTDLNGEHPKPLPGGPAYSFPVRAQQIVTLRFRTAGRVAATELVTRWDEMVPPAKLAALHAYSNEKGHPPRGN